MKAVNLVFPHQLFEESELLENDHPFFLIEEYLFFKQYAFHKQKIAFHRATMKSYKEHLLAQNKSVTYIESNNPLADIRNWKNFIKEEKIERLFILDPTDDWLMKRIHAICSNCDLTVLENPQFLNTSAELQTFFKKDKQSFFQTSFYINERKNRSILIKEGEPKGGNWTYDSENRKKYPKNKKPPTVSFPNTCDIYEEAVTYTQNNFADNYGELSSKKYYPINFEEAKLWLQAFLEQRFEEFGPYEDAIVANESILNHSVLSPLINAGLLSPKYIITKALSYAENNNTPINSVEGFIRQIIGWREFIRGMYECKGTESRNKNFWKFDKKIPPAFYNGTTGIAPVDITIQKVLKTGYCHHIERLMVLGNFMLLCEFQPSEVYKWFMELFIDAYDWVMVPNVYGMSQFADGGTFATKPYLSSSNYIKKMSDFDSGEWNQIWDGLFWRFINKHENYFENNPRTSMMVNILRKLDTKTLSNHLATANNFLNSDMMNHT